ncbi:MAG TPA: tRNA pseudouridine(38-40) synthase TruA [Actinomycetaceae bacterium]|nr:tRNA pseudouridine(38-40) synthase TruA [Actinomycetaceae bacterium]
MPVRVRLDIAYDGSAFSGWAAQPGLATIEGTLETALATLARGAVRLTVAGRTDAGVHARGQVAHVDLPLGVWTAAPGRSSRPPAAAFVRRVNALLQRSRGPQPDIVVTGAALAPAGFDSRFSALARRYCYRISDAKAPRDPLARAHVLWWDRRLDVDAMERAGAAIIGEHDFRAFCKPREGATTIRTLQRLEVRRTDPGLIEIEVQADAFCHSMVRALVGSLISVGEGRAGADHLALRLESRTHDGMVVARAHGLTLEEVLYPPDDQLAARAMVARRRRDEAAPEG